MAEYAPQVFMDAVEKVIAHAPAHDVQQGHRHHVADGGRGRGLAHHRRWHPEGADGPRSGVHLQAAAGRRRSGQGARRSDHGPGCVHEGGGRRRCDGGQAGQPADHDGELLQRLGCTVGGPRRSSSGST